VALSATEKLAGRAFRDARQAALDALNEASPPDAYVMTFWRVVRHECPAAGGASIGISLREHCELSPEYRVCYCGEVYVPGPGFPHGGCDGSKVASRDGAFAWIWKEGKCSGCERAVRARKGLFALAADRQADRGRADDGRAARAHPGNPRVPRA
jgi:hypothetical protein